MIVTVSATAFHLVRGEISSAAITMVLLAMATFAAYMRYRVLPIGVRGAALATSVGHGRHESRGAALS
jgi:hypothetical protein